MLTTSTMTAYLALEHECALNREYMFYDRLDPLSLLSDREL